MSYAVMYAENAEIVATYRSRGEALRALAQIVAADPGSADEVGVRAYSAGRPVGEFESASSVRNIARRSAR